MAASNLDCNVSDGMCSFQSHGLNIFSPSDYERASNCLNMQPTISPIITNATFDEVQANDGLTSELINERTESPLILDSNENCSNAEQFPHFMNMQTPAHSGEVNDNVTNFAKSISHPLQHSVQNMPEALFINVDSDDEGVHSWRPHLSADSLCQDFFMTSMPLLFNDNLNLNMTAPVPNQSEEEGHNTRSVDWTTDFNNVPFVISPKPEDKLTESTSSDLTKDIDSHVHSQMVGLNIIRYEMINTRRKANLLNEEVRRLTQKLNEKLIVQRALDVEKLKEENAQLRLECQCLCMEVDHYVKGKAPLGEIDENFYKKKLQPMKKNASQDEAQSSTNQQISDDINNQEDCKKWDCHKCTFVNHPAINACEMCQTPRRCSEHPMYQATSSETCYCHPEEDTS